MTSLPDRELERAAIILAGGEGQRLRDLTRKIMGHYVPKQFCPVVGQMTLLEQTQKRVALSVRPERTLTVVTRAHERFYSPLVGDACKERLVVQPANRGTAPAILYSLLRLAELSAEASVAVFPSDHYVGDDMAFMRHVELAFDAAEEWPELTVLLGIAPDRPETGYGWIEPAKARTPEGLPILPVHRFWEKPPRDVARRLLAGGCLWNSFVIVSRLSTLVGLLMTAIPGLYASFIALRPTLNTVFEERAVERLYADLTCADFSHAVLVRFPMNLGVLPVCGVAWSDLGEPGRVMETLSQRGLHPRWATA